MARFTPAGNPAGRFLAGQYADLDRVFAAAAPLTPCEVDALIWALGELDTYVQLNSLAAGDLTPSKLSRRFRDIERTAKELLQKLGGAEDIGYLSLPEQIRYGLKHFAEEEAKKVVGGFPNHPPETRRTVVDDEEVCYTVFHAERQIQQNIEGISQLSRWARQAKAENKLASSREGKDSEEAERASQELARSGMKKGRKIKICEEIFEIWAGFLEKPLRTSTRSSDGEPSGPLTNPSGKYVTL